MLYKERKIDDEYEEYCKNCKASYISQYMTKEEWFERKYKT
jgi:hypothetical protein